MNTEVPMSTQSPMDTQGKAPSDKGRVLTALARAAIARELTGSMQPDADALMASGSDWLVTPGASFVTLTRHGELRGCMGTLEAHRPLGEDVEANARAAAFGDPRFPPLSRNELDQVRVEVSLLSRAEPLRFTSEADALAQLRPGIDGLILEYGPRRATFLPQVWEQLPEPRLFLAQLKRKAGLETTFWAEGIQLSRYRVEKYQEATS